jgi:N-glycosylase/DNA lyase
MNEIHVDDFDLRTTVECGQTFCWKKEGSGYINTDLGQVLYVEQRGDRIYYETSSDDVSFETLFRLNDPLLEIQKEITKDEFMKKCIEFAPGLRIVSDPFFPCLISFLTSIWKNISAIKTMTQILRRKFGPRYRFKGKYYYGFPSAETLAIKSADVFRNLGFGFRSEFIMKTSSAISSEDLELKSLKNKGYQETHELLRTLHGVGNKVADCVCLFSLGYLEAFPIDIWIERVVNQKYGIFSEMGTSYAKKSKAARSYFGRYAGYAQQYLFHYTRSCGLSK